MAGKRAKRAFVVGLFAAQTSACSTTAKITRYSGPDLEARITGGTPGAIVVKGEGDLSYSMDRRDIREVDHPGNVVATIGGVLSGYGLLNIAVGLDRCRDDSRYASDAEQGGYCTGVFAPAAVGVGMLAWGLSVYLRSKHAFEDTSLPPQTVNALPTLPVWSPATPGPLAPEQPLPPIQPTPVPQGVPPAQPAPLAPPATPPPTTPGPPSG